MTDTIWAPVRAAGQLLRRLGELAEGAVPTRALAQRRGPGVLGRRPGPDHRGLAAAGAQRGRFRPAPAAGRLVGTDRGSGGLPRGPRTAPADSVGVILAGLIGLAAVFLLVWPHHLGKTAGLLLAAAVAANAAVAFNHPALIEHLDHEYEQRQQMSRTLMMTDEDVMTMPTNGRVGMRAAPAADQQRGDLDRGWLYLLNGRWLAVWAAAGVVFAGAARWAGGWACWPAGGWPAWPSLRRRAGRGCWPSTTGWRRGGWRRSAASRRPGKSWRRRSNGCRSSTGRPSGPGCWPGSWITSWANARTPNDSSARFGLGPRQGIAAGRGLRAGPALGDLRRPGFALGVVATAVGFQPVLRRRRQPARGVPDFSSDCRCRAGPPTGATSSRTTGNHARRWSCWRGCSPRARTPCRSATGGPAMDGMGPGQLLAAGDLYRLAPLGGPQPARTGVAGGPGSLAAGRGARPRPARLCPVPGHRPGAHQPAAPTWPRRPWCPAGRPGRPGDAGGNPEHVGRLLPARGPAQGGAVLLHGVHDTFCLPKYIKSASQGRLGGL